MGLMTLGRLHDQDLMVLYLLDGPPEALYTMLCEFDPYTSYALLYTICIFCICICCVYTLVG